MTMNITEELLERLTIAQLSHVHHMTRPEYIAHISDDQYDYLEGALDLASRLLTLNYEGDLEGFAKIFDPNQEQFAGHIRPDGVCDEIWNLLLPKQED